MILAGDVGGTNTRLALFTLQDGRLGSVAEETFRRHQHVNLESLVRQFTATQRLPVKAACFAVAGPVRRGRFEAVNLAATPRASDRQM
jgi:glucokinase